MALTLLAAGLASPAAAQGPFAPVDRAVVAMPPVYPVPSPDFLRLPETRSLPILPARTLGDPVPGGAVRVGAASVPAMASGDRPVWQPARLEAVTGVDAGGRITSMLEYTPGRFER